jgi:hypothetical protein
MMNRIPMRIIAFINQKGGYGGMKSTRCEFSLIADANGKILSNRFHDADWGGTCWSVMD